MRVAHRTAAQWISTAAPWTPPAVDQVTLRVTVTVTASPPTPPLTHKRMA